MVKKMKVPLKYQTGEFDCATVTYLNAISVLFDREEIPGEIIKGIFNYTMDLYDKKDQGGGGTSRVAHLQLTNFLNDYSKNHKFGVNIEMYYGSKVNGALLDLVLRRGIVVARVFLGVEHYVLITQIDREFVYLFDPYYVDDINYDSDASVWMVNDKNKNYNRKVKRERLLASTLEDLSLGPIKARECAVLFRK